MNYVSKINIFNRENIVVWPSKQGRHQSNGQIMLTKVMSDIDFTDWICNLVHCVTFNTRFSLDFHGLLKSEDLELKFQFASKNTGIKYFDDKQGELWLERREDRIELISFLQKQTMEDIQNNWLQTHADELGWGGTSGFQAERLISAVIYLEPLEIEVEQIFGDLLVLNK